MSITEKILEYSDLVSESDLGVNPKFALAGFFGNLFDSKDFVSKEDLVKGLDQLISNLKEYNQNKDEDAA